MNTFAGYGISLLLFIGGIALPADGHKDIVKGPQKALAASIRDADTQGDAEVLMKRFGLLELPSLPPVRNDHQGRRVAAPKDQSMRCPNLEPVLEAYGLYPVETWSYIAWRESGCRRKAQNATWDANGNMTYALNRDGSYDTGLLQINSSWKSVTAKVCGDDAIENHMQGLKTVDCNLRVARYIMENSKGGLANWNM